MNLLEYRALKAEEEAAKNSQNTQGSGEQSHAQVVESTTPVVQSGVQETNQNQSVPPVQTTENGAQSAIGEAETSQSASPQVFEINGQQVTLDELQKGYLRQSDYTRKTQDIARQARELEYAKQVMERVKQNPEVAQQIQFDPIAAERDLLEAQKMDLALQREVDTLGTKYADFDVAETLEFALAHQLPNLEDAYLLNKTYKGEKPQIRQTPSITQTTQAVTLPDMEALKAQIRQELLAEQNTNTIITGQGGTTPVTPSAPHLTPQELSVAKNMGMSPEEYARWR
jgi:hypothetical protein